MMDRANDRSGQGAELRLAVAEELDRTDAAYRDTGSGGIHSQPSQRHRSEEKLTERETEVLVLIGQGMSNPEITRALRISIRTVETHVSHIYAKLHIDTRPHAVVYAIRKGLAQL